MAARFESMPSNSLNVVLQHLLAHLGPDGSGMTDGELLARFLSNRDKDALAALVRRHAAMVWGVCHRLLRDHHPDAEDAFQATFLVLVRKAADVPRQAVANWLYGVARQTAVRVRANTAKRGWREKQVVDMPEPTVEEVRDGDLAIVLDEELSRLPRHYRGVLVLCDLEGMTRKEAARQLGMPEGSVASRLARARALLAKRLIGRGIVLAGGSVAAAAPPDLVASTIEATSLIAAGKAAGVISARVVALAEGVVKAMFVTRMKGVLAVVLMVGLSLGGIGVSVGLPTSPVAVAQEKTPDKARALDDRPPASDPLKRAERDVADAAAQVEVARAHLEQAQAIHRRFKQALDKLRKQPRGEKPPEARKANDSKPVPARSDSLDGLWEDIENKGGWLRFDGSTIKYHPAAESDETVVIEWTCRYKLTVTPMTIDIFHKDGTAHGIFVVERGALFIALTKKLGEERPTRFTRDAATTLFVLKRAVQGEAKATPPKTMDDPFAGAPQHDTPQGSGRIVVHGILESVDARKSMMTVKDVTGDSVASLISLLAVVSKKPVKEDVAGTASGALLKAISNRPRLVNVPVRSNAMWVRSSGVGVVKEKLQVKDLKAGQVVSLQLAPDRDTGFVVVGVRVLNGTR
jgi:RNA polymerase sigma factor (sigma-70 family)